MTAKEYLTKVQELNRAVEAALSQLTTLEADAARTTRLYETVQISGSSADHERALVRLMEARRKCSEINNYYVNYKTLIIERINMLKRPAHRKILTAVYIETDANGERLPWEQIAERMHFSVRQAQRIHGEALMTFRRVMPSGKDVARCREMSRNVAPCRTQT